MQSRVEEAVKTFEEGYNCAQAVFATYADLFGLDRETALKLTSSMGGGVGRMREVCGTVTGMALLVGLKVGKTDPGDDISKEKIYILTRQMADKFKEQQESIICRELLGIKKREESAKPSERTKEYYGTRPCSKLVACAAKITEEILLEDIA